MIDINSFVPEDQQPKLALIADANAILAPRCAASSLQPPVTPETDPRWRRRRALAQIEPALAKLPTGSPAGGDRRRSAPGMSAAEEVLLAIDRALTRFLPDQLDQLRTVLSASR